jgi:hypothetical protein
VSVSVSVACVRLRAILSKDVKTRRRTTPGEVPAFAGTAAFGHRVGTACR